VWYHDKKDWGRSETGREKPKPMETGAAPGDIVNENKKPKVKIAEYRYFK
jgi:hypothetical protein